MRFLVGETAGQTQVFVVQGNKAKSLTQAVPGYPPHPDLASRLAEGAASPVQARYGTIDGDETLRAALADITPAGNGAGNADAGGLVAAAVSSVVRHRGA